MNHVEGARIAVIGGGIMGVTLGYFLARQGGRVVIYEASPVLGGLAGPLLLDDGTSVDRYYHAILSSDVHLGALCADLNLRDRLRYRETRMGFFYQDRVHPMNGIVDFLRFPPLGWADRFRLGLTVLAAQRVQDWQQLEKISVEEWLLRWGGKNTYSNIWRPMLKAKFDGGFDRVPATWIWARLVRMKSTRKGASQTEKAGYLIGGYSTLLQAMAQEINAQGGAVLLNTPVQELAIENGRVVGVIVEGKRRSFDSVVATAQTPVVSRLIPDTYPSYRQTLAAQEYLGILCPLLVLDRPLSGYWTINMTDDSVPFTGVIETTAYIDPMDVGGRHLVYLPKYTVPDSKWQQLSDEEIKSVWLENLQRMFSDFTLKSVRYFVVGRERYVEPLHRIGDPAVLPLETPIGGFFLATTSQIYPQLTNGESVTVHARRAAERILAGISSLAPIEMQENAAATLV